MNVKSTGIVAIAIAALGLCLPLAAFAHEYRVYQIGDKTYSLVVGSVNEPVAVDDKSGVELIVSQLPKVQAKPDVGSDDGPSGMPVIGLDATLQVEVSAGSQKKTLSLVPEEGNPGAYEAVFLPTVATTYSYRIFGAINGVPLNVSYACNPAGDSLTAQDSSQQRISDQVTQTMQGGSFPCPVERASLQFPQSTPSQSELADSLQVLQDRPAQHDTLAWLIAVAALGFSLAAWMKTKKQ